MKKLISLVLVAMLLATLCSSAMGETIVMIGQQLGNVVFLDAEKGMNDAGKDLGIDVEWQSPLRAEAASGSLGDGVTWTVAGPEDDLTLTISGTGQTDTYPAEEIPFAQPDGEGKKHAETE